MKPEIREIRKVFAFALLFIISTSAAFAQSIYSLTADNAIPTEYSDYSSTDQDSVFVFCSDSPNAGTLSAPFSGCTYLWYEYNNGLYVSMGITTETINNLPTGGYRVVTACSGDTSCYNAWVFVNQTIVDVYIENDGQNVGNELIGCDSFLIHGTASPATNDGGA